MSRNHYFVPMYTMTVRADGTRREDYVAVDTFDNRDVAHFPTREAARAKADELNGDAFIEAQKSGVATGFAAHR